MTRIRIVGLCLVAAFATGAIVACAPKEKTVEELIERNAKGEIVAFETWPDSRPIEGKTATTLSSSGDILSGVKWTGAMCHSAGAKEGEVKTVPTIQELGWIDKAKGEVGLEERPAKGTILATFTCGKNTVELRGADVGAVAPINKAITA